ncbi:carboxypeptidase regulatory-like domain-containing protein [Rhodococcus olei]|uniref:carboxypeptidase regulatory-like domain-containing protein n=1 Tax=Rhodococcus olei TaxID=2161675 RepID=UPI0031EBFC0E
MRRDGRHALTGLRPGTYTLIVTAAGFDPQAPAVTVSDRAPATCNFALVGDAVLSGTVDTRSNPGRSTRPSS